MSKEPRTLSEAIRYFADPDVALRTKVELRWPQGVHCPRCGSVNVGFIKTRRMWECKEKHEKRQFSAKVGTVFEDSALGLDKWFTAIWMIATCKNGVSSYELARAIGVTQKSAWFMLHRIRLAMKAGSFDKFNGAVEPSRPSSKPSSRTGDGKEEGKVSAPESKPMERFRALAQKVVQADPNKLRHKKE